MFWWFVPLSDEDVIVRGEHVLYRQRRHWAAILNPLAQFAAVVFLRMALAIGDPRGVGMFLFFGGLLSLIVLRPLVMRDRSWHTAELVGLAVFGFYLVSSGQTVSSVANLVVAAMAARFVIVAIRWAFFQRLYLTDRRLMEVDGFLGSKVNSMPISKVTDCTLFRSPMGELLGYGTFRVESAGQDQALGNLRFLLEPERFHDLVVSSPSWGPR